PASEKHSNAMAAQLKRRPGTKNPDINTLDRDELRERDYQKGISSSSSSLWKLRSPPAAVPAMAGTRSERSPPSARPSSNSSSRKRVRTTSVLYFSTPSLAAYFRVCNCPSRQTFEPFRKHCSATLAKCPL